MRASPSVLMSLALLATACPEQESPRAEEGGSDAGRRADAAADDGAVSSLDRAPGVDQGERFDANPTDLSSATDLAIRDLEAPGDTGDRDGGTAQDAAQADVAAPDVALADATLADAARDDAQADAARDDAAQADAARDDAAQDDAAQVDAARDDAAQADAARDDAAQADSARDDAAHGDAAQADAGPAPQPRLGLYTVSEDGSDLALLIDLGDQEISHVRELSGTDWLTGTRYNDDVDGNGMAMEGEGDEAYYLNTEIVVFRRSAPSQVSVVTGPIPGRAAANSSWTADSKLVFLQGQADGSIKIARASFTQIPTVASIVEVPVPGGPTGLSYPVDPHQHGPSDATGFIVLSAYFKEAASGLWMRPLWKLPATGEVAWSQTQFLGCPVCPDQGGCCGWSEFSAVLGTNDARISHDGAWVTWMQQHPDHGFVLGDRTVHVYRQVMKEIGSPGQTDLIPAGLSDYVVTSFGDWRADDQRLVYWTIEIELPVIKQRLYTMARDGGDRRLIALPDELCVSHPAYLSSSQIVFTAWTCGGELCTCQQGAL